VPSLHMGFFWVPMHLLFVSVEFAVGLEGFAAYLACQPAFGHLLKRLLGHRRRIWDAAGA
jgi:hypothetical protein